MTSYSSFAIALVLALPLPAQCPPIAVSHPAPELGATHATATAEVFCSNLWDPDGGGPLSEQLVVGGLFTKIDGVPCQNIVRRDPLAGWVPLGTDLPAAIDIEASPTGELAAVTLTPGEVWKWNGNSWDSLNAPAAPSDIAFLPNGHLVASTVGSGPFGVPGSVHVFDGISWTTLPAPPNNAYVNVRAVAVRPNGNIIASYSHIVPRVWEWDGITWTQLPSPIGAPHTLAVSPTGQVAGGHDGAGVSLGNTVLATANIREVRFTSNGDLLVAGLFSQIGNLTTNWVARWDGSAFQPISTPPVATTSSTYSVIFTALELPNGDIFTGGRWDSWAGIAQAHVALHTATGWSSFSDIGFNGDVNASVATTSDDIVVAGAFTTIDYVAANHIARRTGAVWTPLGLGTDGPIEALAESPNGDIIAGGSFAHAGGSPVSNIAIWDGNTWHSLGSGVNGPVTAVAVSSNGDVYASGAFAMAGGVAANNVARWDGSTWHALGSGLSHAANALLAEGMTLTAAGGFIAAGGLTANRIAQYDGASWSSFGAGFNNDAHALLRRASGDLVVSGAFTMAGNQPANQIAEWDGANWTAMANGLPSSAPIRSLVRAGHDTVMAVQQINPTLHQLSRWDGASWNPIVDFDAPVQAISRMERDLFASGPFTTVAGQPTHSIARVASSCAPVAVDFGAGCAVGGQIPALSAANLPWLGATVSLDATGLPAQCISASVFGLGLSYLPLGSVLPTAPGCSTLVRPDLIVAGVPIGGVLTNHLPIPTNPALVGQFVYHTVVALELNSNGVITSAGVTNGLRMQLGTM